MVARKQRERMRKGLGLYIVLKSMPPVTYHLQLGLTSENFHCIPRMPPNCKSIKEVIY
jgi:hypothetical protein